VHCACQGHGRDGARQDEEQGMTDHNESGEKGAAHAMLMT